MPKNPTLYNQLQNRQRAYLDTFKGVPAEEVLKDLAKFCRAEESTFHADPRMHAVLEGRREVWIRIQKHLRLNVDDVYAYFVEGKKE